MYCYLSLKVLNRENIDPDIIVGSSMGAFIGGVYASGVSIDKIEKIALQTDIKLTAKMLAPGLPTHLVWLELPN